MRIIVAPDSYKGSLSSSQVADAVERGILSVYPQAEVIKNPIADGGEGTIQALVKATGGQFKTSWVTDPLGNRINAAWGILGNEKTAVIEMASASGLPLVAPSLRNPLVTTTFGTGELIKAALDHGLRDFIIGIGGSATNDGGAGMAQALGVKFCNRRGEELQLGGAALKDLEVIDVRGIDPRLAEATILVACDVDNPLSGPRGASAVYGPQKGASPAMVAVLDEALRHYGEVARQTLGKNIVDLPGAGAAGGLGAGLLFFTTAQLRPGVGIVLEATGFADKVKQADLVITGEGLTDRQTAFGKAPMGVAKIAKNNNVPVVCLSGGLGSGYEEVYEQGIDSVFSIVPGPMNLDDCMAAAGDLVKEATVRLCRLLRVGGRMVSEKGSDDVTG